MDFRFHEVSDEEFKRLTKVSMVVYFGDNIPDEMTDNRGLATEEKEVNLAGKMDERKRSCKVE